jgi:predicted O-methyltransferase YrrM
MRDWYIARNEVLMRSAASCEQVSPEEGQFLAWLVETLNVRRAIEVGVFTGYSSIAMALVRIANMSLLLLLVQQLRKEVTIRDFLV